MMSAEGVGIVITGAGLFITLIGLGVSGGIAYGTIKTKLDGTTQKLLLMDVDNKEGHTKIFDCQKETDIKMGKVEQHLLSMNGSMKQHTAQIEQLEKDSHSRGD